MDYYLGIDLGTSSLKIILADNQGRILGNSSSSFSIISEKEGYSEENPTDWLRAFDRAFSEMLERYPQIKENIVSIAFSGQMHSLVMIDEEGIPIRPAILWNDVRTTEQVKQLNTDILPHLLSVEKNIPLEGFTLPKILWVMENEPENWKKVWKFMMPKDYLIYYLTGKVCTDYSDASGTIMYDVRKHQWDEEILTRFDIRLDQCPELLYSTDSAGVPTEQIKKKFNITKNFAVIMGGADNACGALGTIDNIEEQGLISVGTSGVVLTYSNDSMNQVGKYHYFNSLIEEQDYKMGVTLSAGYSFDWFKERFAHGEDFETLTKKAEESSIGSKGVLFLPYLFGERSPYYNVKMSAEFVGMKAYHNDGDLIRSVLEGVAFSLKNVYQTMRDLSDKQVQKFRITGGVVKNPLWLQMFADIFNSEIEVLAIDEGPAFGALICAIHASTGQLLSEIWKKYNQVKKIYSPEQKAVIEYEVYYQKFKLLSDQMDASSCLRIK